jgi:ParB-like chromosome segregation protein Spo0J
MRTSAVIYCTSNLLTRVLGAMEESHIITHMVSEEHFTLEEIGKLWGRSKSWVSRRMGLLVHLQPKLRKELTMGYLSPRMAQELFRLPRGNEQDRVLRIIRRDHLNKDEAALLIGDWLGMDEEGKKRMERKTFLTETTPVTNGDISFAKEQLNICVQSVARMMDMLLEPSWMGAVPAGDWYSFRRLVRILRCRVENLSSERG